MKTIRLPLLLLMQLLVLSLQAQQNPHILEMNQAQSWFSAHPEAVQARAQLLAAARQYSNPSTQAVATIPVVFHVVYNTAAQNIPDSVLAEQLQVLNEDYNKLNADTTIAVTYGFQSMMVDCGIHFALATVDPNGNPTTGIERRQISSNVSFPPNDDVKHYSSNGLDSWDCQHYMNVWVCNLGSGSLGYGEFPTATPSSTYGAVVKYDVVGLSGAVAPYGRGRTLTHEMAHCFGLYHEWLEPNCTWMAYDSLVGIAPVHDMNSFDTCCAQLYDSCTPNFPGIPWMNFMHYNYDANLCMFTQGQKAVMWSAITNFYPGLLTYANDAGCASVLYPAGNLCDTVFAPIAQLKNFGSAALTSCTVNYQVDSGPVNTVSGVGTIAPFSSVTDTLPTIAVSPGPHLLTVWTSNPNGNTDVNTFNDQDTAMFNASAGGLTLPFTEGFENPAFPPPGWALENPDHATTWARDTLAALTGMASAMMDNYNYSGGNGQRDGLITPPLDLTSMSTPGVLFEHAYQLYSTQFPSDTLNIYVSTDCGLTWNLVFQQADTALVTTNALTTMNAFIPNTSEWRPDTIDLSAYATCNHALLKFENISEYQNNLYLDELSVTQLLVAGTVLQENGVGVKLSPNPTEGPLFLDLKIDGRSDVRLCVRDAVGRVQYSRLVPAAGCAVYPLDFSALASGVYFLDVRSDHGSTTKKFVIAH